MEALDIVAICKRIAVHPPYFAFSSLSVAKDEAVTGVFAPEQSIGHERGPMATAEIGRHLAILGSCAAVASRPAKMTYYLATRAQLTMLQGNHQRTESRSFEAVASVVQQDRRSLTADVIARDGKPFAYLRCEYKILPESVFSKVFKDHYTGPSATPDGSPYRRPVPLEFDEPQGSSVVARTLPLPASSFAGHFDNYPSWPVAVLADTFARVRSRLLHHILQKEVDYVVSRVHVDALRLVPAAVPLTLFVQCTSASRALSRYIFSARVVWGDTLVSEMESEVFV